MDTKLLWSLVIWCVIGWLSFITFALWDMGKTYFTLLKKGFKKEAEYFLDNFNDCIIEKIMEDDLDLFENAVTGILRKIPILLLLAGPWMSYIWTKHWKWRVEDYLKNTLSEKEI